MSIEQEKLKEKLKNSRPRGTFEEYQSDIEKYLESKLKKYDVPLHELIEIAECLSYKFIRTYNDEVWRLHKSFQNQMRKSNARGRTNE